MHANCFDLRVKVRKLRSELETAQKEATTQIDQLVARQAEVIELSKQLAATQEKENELTTQLTMLTMRSRSARSLARQSESTAGDAGGGVPCTYGRATAKQPSQM